MSDMKQQANLIKLPLSVKGVEELNVAYIMTLFLQPKLLLYVIVLVTQLMVKSWFASEAERMVLVAVSLKTRSSRMKQESGVII